MRSSVFLSLTVVLMCLAARCGCQSISCYTCNSDPNTGADNSQCKSPGSGTPTVSNCYSCTLSVSTGTNGVPLYARACSNASITAQNNYCTNVYGVYGYCSCNASLCNSHAFSTLGSLTCYSCSSVNNIDNGCGRVIDPKSIYVTQQSGCTACGLTIATSSPPRSGGGWTRSCLHDVDVDSTCSNTGISSTCSFRCTSNLCNAAPMARQAATLSTLAASLACVVAAALKLA